MMQTATREETRFIQRVIIFVVFPLIACIFFSFWLSGRTERVKEKIQNIEKTLERTMKKYGTFPMLKRVSEEKSIYKKIASNYETLKSFATVKPIDPPGDVIEKGVYFKKQLFLAQKGIKEMADKKGLQVPDTIGFGEALPSDKEVSLLLRKLETVNGVLRVLLTENVKTITVIKLLDDIQHTSARGDVIPVLEIAFRVDVNCKEECLVKVLHQIGMMKPFVVIRDVSIKNFKDGLLEASFVFSRLIAEE